MFEPELLTNKLLAIFIMIAGLISVLVSWDITAAVFLFMLALPLFFADKNCVVGDDDVK